LGSAFFIDRGFISHGKVLLARKMDDDIIEARIEKLMMLFSYLEN